LIRRFPALRAFAWTLEAAILGALWLISYCLTPAAASRFGSFIMGSIVDGGSGVVFDLGASPAPAS